MRIELFPTQEIESYHRKNFISQSFIITIDIDFFIRFCIRLNEQEIASTKKNILQYLQGKLPDKAKMWISSYDEYLIYLNDTCVDETKKFIYELKDDFRKQRFTRDCRKEYAKLAITFSAGFAGIDNPKDNLRETIRESMVSLFMAKALRRNKIYSLSQTNRASSNNKKFVDDGPVNVLLGSHGNIGFIKSDTLIKDALLWEPQAIDIDSVGNLYVADQNNNCILKISDSEVIRIVGNGTYGYSGDKGLAINAQLNKPTGLTIHKKNLYITDTGNDAVRCVDLISGVITTIAGNGQAGYSGDGQAANKARLNKPGGIGVDDNLNVYINDIANNVIRKVDAKGIITTYAGTGEYGYYGEGVKASDATFGEIYAIAVNKSTGDLFLADYFNHCIRKVDSKTEKIETIVGSGAEGYTGDGENARQATMYKPVGIYVLENNSLLIAESGNSIIRFFNAKTKKVYTLAGTGKVGTGLKGSLKNFSFANPNGIAASSASNTIFVLDGANNRICSFKSNQVFQNA